MPGKPLTDEEYRQTLRDMDADAIDRVTREDQMNAVHRKHVYSSKSVPHFAVYPQDATHRYLNEAKTEWKYMIARTDQEFLAWGAGWMEDRQPQVKRGGVWRNL